MSSGLANSALSALPTGLLGCVPRPLRPRLGRLRQYAPRPMTKVAVPDFPASPADPTIAVVTPSFGQGRFIERTILSVLGQNYPRLEYFVQDGGSSDETVGILQRHHASLSGWASERDSGQSQAINRGFARTRGEIMAWLNSDDLLLPGTLRVVGDFFRRHPDVDVVYGDRLLIDEEDREIGRWVMPGHDGAMLSWGDYIPQETMFWRRSVWDRAGARVDESLRFAMDWDLLLRFREAGARFAHLPRFLGAFRVHGSQKTSAEIDDVGNREMDLVRERALGHVPTRAERLRAVVPFLLRHMVADLKYAAAGHPACLPMRDA